VTPPPCVGTELSGTLDEALVIISVLYSEVVHAGIPSNGARMAKNYLESKL